MEISMRCAVALLFVVACDAAHAQHQTQHHTPYAGHQQRSVKALSDQQIADLRAGRGMGLALAAELNGYPGPLHVLELAEQLQLSGEQRQQVQRLFDSMKAEATSVGTALIEQETALDRAFATNHISEATLSQLTSQIGETQGRLRAVHLKYHLSTRALLSPEQRERYASLRGYR
jgi:Spy/CpxP family protein refolding chaperone